MLPELEKTIPKPLKKRYRDLFEDDNRTSIDNIQNVSSNKIGTFAFANASHHIPVVKKESNCQLHRPNNHYRKSVIKRSITKHISIIDFEQIAPIAQDADTPRRLQDEANYRLEADDSQASHFVYLSKNYLDSPEVQFVGKLKVKWREKYENYGTSEMKEREKTVLDELSDYGCAGKGNDKKSNAKCVKCNKEPTNESKRFKVDDTEAKIAADDASDDSQVPVVRKLERARKGLIYQKFMAATYSWNKKEKNSTSKPTAVPSQPRKRGRPRNVPEGDKCSKTADLGISESTVTVMRLSRKKNNDTLKYAVVERNSKKPFVVKKT